MSKKKGESFGKQLLRSAAKQFRLREKEPKKPSKNNKQIKLTLDEVKICSS